MENVTDKLDPQVPTIPAPRKDNMCSSSEQVDAATASLTPAEKLNLSSDMAPIIEVVTEHECSSTQEYQQQDGDSINAPPKEQQAEFEVQVINKSVENLLSDETYLKEGQTLKVMTKQVCPSTDPETDVSLIGLAQENEGDPVIMQQHHISPEDINVSENAVITTIESEPKSYECTNIILVTDSTQTGAECQIVETEEEIETKILTENSSCESSSQTDHSSIVLQSQDSGEPLSSQWSLHITDEGKSAVSIEGNDNSEQIEKADAEGKSNPEETYITVVKDDENTELVSVQDSNEHSDEGLTAETLIAISILQNSVGSMNSECQESEAKNEEQVLFEEVVEQLPKSLENSKQITGIEIGVQANDYEIERRSGKVPARRRVIPFKFRDYRNPDNVEQGNDSDSDYCPSENDIRTPKRRRIVPPPVGPTGRRPGRPRKVRSEVTQKQTASPVDTASSPNTQPEKNVDELSQTDSIAQVMTSSQTTSTSEKRIEKSSSYSSSKMNYTCKICQHTFTQKGNLKVHMRVHTGEKPFLCAIKGCSKRFRNNESLRRHNLTHLGIKPFACELCENKFSSKVSLLEHMAIHNNSKPHVCHICQAPFRQISCLRRHLITHSSEKPFECNSCGQKFSQMVYLKSHAKVHTGEKPFVCDHCKRGFAHQSDLIRHKIIHTGKKPFACHICHAKFSDPSSKRRHVKEHMGAKPYSCHLCKDSFKRAGQLKVHLTSKHSNHIDGIQTVKQTQSGQTLQFAFKDSDKLTSIAIDDKSSAYHKKIAQIVEGLTGSEVTHIATPVNLEDVILQDADSVTIEEHASESQTVAQVVASAMQSAGMNSITACNESQLSALCQATDIQEGENGYPDQITATIMEEDIPSLIDGTSDGATVITIVSLDDMEQGQELACTEHTEYTQQIIENVEGDGEEPHFVEVHYEENGVTIKEEEFVTESQALEESEKSENTADFVSKPDFSSQEYYDWLSNFTEICKSLPMPLNPDLFHKISQVHKTLSDVMATPSGVIADKENFRILMNISRDLHFIISEHLTYVLQNLDGEQNADDH